MKLVVIGDIYIDHELIKDSFDRLNIPGLDVSSVQWQLKDDDELQTINLLVEQQGSEAYNAPQYILEAVKEADIIITQFCPVNRQMIDGSASLKMIGVLRAGLENVNVERAIQSGVAVMRTIGRNANAVADFTVGMLLAECRNIARAHMHVVREEWKRDFSNAGRVPDLADKTVGVVGLGQIGFKVAARLKAFDAKIIVCDPYFEGALSDDYRMVDLDTLLRESDVITMHMRLTDITKHMIGEAEIAKMKPTAYIVNTARSGLIDEQALIKALQANRIAGAALDVFDKEPLDNNSPLLKLNNVTLAPHLAGTTRDAFAGAPDILAKEFAKIWSGEYPAGVVNAEQFDQFKAACAPGLI